MQKVNKLRISVSKQRKRTKVLILENNRSIVSPTDRITSYIKQPEKGYLGSSCVIWAQPFFLLCVRISLLVGIQRCLDHLCFLFAKESMRLFSDFLQQSPFLFTVETRVATYFLLILSNSHF